MTKNFPTLKLYFLKHELELVQLGIRIDFLFKYGKHKCLNHIHSPSNIIYVVFATYI